MRSPATITLLLAIDIIDLIKLSYLISIPSLIDKVNRATGKDLIIDIYF